MVASILKLLRQPRFSVWLGTALVSDATLARLMLFARTLVFALQTLGWLLTRSIGWLLEVDFLDLQKIDLQSLLLLGDSLCLLLEQMQRTTLRT